MSRFVVSPEQREKYRTDGYVIFRSVLSRGLVADAGKHVEWLIKKHPDVRPENLGHDLMLDDPFRFRLVADDRLLDIAEALLGPDIALFASDYVCKPAGTGRPVLWHQDAYYWSMDPMEVITAWVAVDDSDRENGCMRVIPGSHRDRRLQTHLGHSGVPAVLSSEIDQSAVDETKAVDVELKAGDVSVHDPFLIHGSNPNRSNRRRCGATIQYIPTSTKVNWQWPMFLLRGQDRHHKNPYLSLPNYREGYHFRFHDAANYQGGNTSA